MESELINTPIIELINKLANEIREVNKANGWNIVIESDWELEYKIPAKIALSHSELSEGLEAFRKDDRDNFAEELADTIIRILDITSGLKINIGKEIMDKLEVNRHRGYRHGGKKA